ncbi:MAG: hypothetical protein LIO94_12855 [Clostridiales bacterium]|nr:hypothetical protein [Clostridiales bacterium]
MTDGSFYTLIDLFVIGCGIYTVVQYILMVRTGELRQNMLLPKDIQIGKCKDTKGFIKAIGVKQLAFGIVATICGIVGLVQDVMNIYNVYVYMTTMVLFLVFCVWYAYGSKKAIEAFW